MRGGGEVAPIRREARRGAVRVSGSRPREDRARLGIEHRELAPVPRTGNPADEREQLPVRMKSGLGRQLVRTELAHELTVAQVSDHEAPLACERHAIASA